MSLIAVEFQKSYFVLFHLFLIHVLLQQFFNIFIILTSLQSLLSSRHLFLLGYQVLKITHISCCSILICNIPTDGYSIIIIFYMSSYFINIHSCLISIKYSSCWEEIETRSFSTLISRTTLLEYFSS